MGKKGGSKHFVRIRAEKRLGIKRRKEEKWLASPSAGPHKKSESISAGILLRDVLGMAGSMREAKRIISLGALFIDGKKVRETEFPIGIMDIISIPAEKKLYRMGLSGSRLAPQEIDEKSATRKYLKASGKHTVKKGKTCITFHDGRNCLLDNRIKPGDTCVFSVPTFKLASHIPLQPGVTCLIVDGKHIGETAKLQKLIERPGSHEKEALLLGKGGEFITVAKYLFAVDEYYTGERSE